MLGFIVAGITAITSFAFIAMTRAISTTIATSMKTLILVKHIVSLIEDLAKSLNITDSEDEIREIGDRVIQAEENGIMADKYETWKDYKEALENFELDSKRSLEIEDEDKEVVGLAFALKETELEMDSDVSTLPESIKDVPELLEKEMLEILIKELKKEGYSAFDIKNYFDGDLSAANLEKIDSIIEKLK